jgi:putative transposase
MTGDGKAALWRERLRRFARSGLTVTRFCQEEGVSAPSFYQWRKRLSSHLAIDAADAADKMRDAGSPAFQQFAVMTGPSAGVAIELRSGTRIELPPHNVELVRAVIRELTLAESDANRSTGDGRC